MGYIIEGYKIMGKETASYIKTHRAGIGTAVSICGTILSNILSTRAGAKSARMIDAKMVELGRPLDTKEKIALCWKNHAGSAATTVVSCIGAGYSHNQHVKDFNHVATAYAGIKKLYDSTKKATKEVLGEKKDIELQDKLNKKYLEDHPEEKKRIVETTNNPNPGVTVKFWEPVTGITFFSTVDKINLVLQEMNSEMKLIEPRKNGAQWVNEHKRVLLMRFFELLDVDIPLSIRESETMKFMGFIKGKEDNGSDDDKIDCYFSPMLIDDVTAETCTAINWVVRPSDVRYGDYVKL